MDRATNSHSGMIHSNKKSNESLKLTESFLCDEIHDNLRTLALIHPMTDEFKSVFEKVSDLVLSLNQLIARLMEIIFASISVFFLHQKGMFIKPNTKAFPHVMKYLFMICDPTDFRKKFCWPIYNKAAEATFRFVNVVFVSFLFSPVHCFCTSFIQRKLCVISINPVFI